MKVFEKNTEEKHECFCQKRAKDILAIAIGSFIGVYCALSLFAAIHRPPCPMMYHHFGPHYNMMHWQTMKHQFPKMEKFKHEDFGVDFEQKKPVENKK